MEKENFCYYVGSKNKYKDTKELILPKGRYSIFDVGSRKQNDIIKTKNIIYTQWLHSTNYTIDEDWNFELYIGDNCYLYIKIKDIQN